MVILLVEALVKLEELALMEPLTLSRLLPVKVKLVEVAKVLLPAPNSRSPLVKFCSWRVGVVPPEERREPEPETEVTRLLGKLMVKALVEPVLEVET